LANVALRKTSEPPQTRSENTASAASYFPRSLATLKSTKVKLRFPDAATSSNLAASTDREGAVMIPPRNEASSPNCARLNTPPPMNRAREKSARLRKSLSENLAAPPNVTLLKTAAPRKVARSNAASLKVAEANVTSEKRASRKTASPPNTAPLKLERSLNSAREKSARCANTTRFSPKPRVRSASDV
jgi:hypothetical protein